MSIDKKHLKIGMLVEIRIDKKEDMTSGFIAEFKGGSAQKGVRVQLTNGIFGYVERIIPKHEHELATAKFYIKLVRLDHVYYLSEGKGMWIWNRRAGETTQSTCFLFTSEQSAKEFLGKQKIDKTVRRFKGSKTITSFLKDSYPDVVFIDGNRKIKRRHLEEQEKMYRVKMGL